MNDPYRYPWGPQNNTKEEYIAAWRHVVDAVSRGGREERAYGCGRRTSRTSTGTSIIRVMTTWTGSRPALSISVRSRNGRGGGRFDEIFGTKYERLASFGKPVMIAEFGSLAVGGDRAEWFDDALRALPAKYPMVKAVLFFETGSDQTVTYQKVDWRIATDSVASASVARALAGLAR